MEVQNVAIIVNEIRCLCADIVQQPRSGHPGGAIGMSPMAYVLFSKFLRFSPSHPDWIARDRFILSNGHASPLQYSLLHLFGYNYTIEDLKQFRMLHSKTPGHPERVDFANNHKCDGVEVTTGALGQGVANAVGMALAQRALQQFDPENVAVDPLQRIYVFCGDGCLQEGISTEACSLAGTLKLKNIILFYDDNRIQIDGSTEIAFTEDVTLKFKGFHWNVLIVENADTDLQAIQEAIVNAQQSETPTIIKMRTTIGYGTEKAGKSSVHGAPVGPELIKKMKESFNLPKDETFYISQQTKQHMLKLIQQKEEQYKQWEQRFNACKYKDELIKRFKFSESIDYQYLNNVIGQEKIQNYINLFKDKPARHASQAVLNLLYQSNFGQYMIVGCADLKSSVMSDIINVSPTQYIHYGVREMAMCAISNGIAAYGGFIPFDATFLVFVSYCIGSIRVGALSRLPAIHFCSHDSIQLGEDGPSHEPVETVAQIRAMPGVYDWRPCDCREVLGSYMGSLIKNTFQHVFCNSRQILPMLPTSCSEKTSKYGAYVIRESETAKYTFLTSGSEVMPCFQLAEKHDFRVVSMPSFKLFSQQEKSYQKQTLKHDRYHIIAVEPYVSFGLHKYAEHCIGIESYGASGTTKQLQEHFKMDLGGIEEQILQIIKQE